jgi:hypothetical protein
MLPQRLAAIALLLSTGAAASILLAEVPVDSTNTALIDAVSSAILAAQRNVTSLDRSDARWLFAVTDNGNVNENAHRLLVDSGFRLANLDISVKYLNSHGCTTTGASTEAVAGVGAVACALLLVVIGGLLWAWRRRRLDARVRPATTRPGGTPISDFTSLPWLCELLRIDTAVSLRLDQLGISTIDDVVERRVEVVGIDCPPHQQRALRQLVYTCQAATGKQ